MKNNKTRKALFVLSSDSNEFFTGIFRIFMHILGDLNSYKMGLQDAEVIS